MEAALLPGLVPTLSQTWSGWGCQASSKLPPGDLLRPPHHSQWAWSLLLMGLPGWPFMALGGLCLQAPGVLLSLPLHPETGPLPSPHSPSLLQGCPFRGAESGHRVPAGLSHHSGVSVVLLAVPPSWGAGKALRLLGRGPARLPAGSSHSGHALVLLLTHLLPTCHVPALLISQPAHSPSSFPTTCTSS